MEAQPAKPNTVAAHTGQEPPIGGGAMGADGNCGDGRAELRIALAHFASERSAAFIARVSRGQRSEWTGWEGRLQFCAPAKMRAVCCRSALIPPEGFGIGRWHSGNGQRHGVLSGRVSAELNASDLDDAMFLAEMAVNLHGEGPAVLVAKPARDGRDVHAGLNAGGREEMAQIVVGEVGQAKALAGFAKRCLGVTDGADRVLLRGLAFCAEALQQAAQGVSHRDGAAFVVLGAVVAPGDGESAGVEIDLCPAERSAFTKAHPAEGEQFEQVGAGSGFALAVGATVAGADGGYDLLELLAAGDGDLRLRDTATANVAGGIAENEAGFDGVIEDGFHRAEFMREGLGGESGATLGKPAFAVGLGDVAQGDVAEVGREALEGATPPLDAPGLQGVAGDSQPAVGGLVEIRAGFVSKGEVADLAAEFLKATLG